MRLKDNTRFQFRKYVEQELRSSINPLICDLLERQHELNRFGSEAWTAAIFGFFAEAAAPGIFVYSKRGAFLWDLVHATWDSSAKWNDIVQGKCQLKLVLESEAGKQNARGYGTKAILYDAAKIAHARADAKVMIFRSCNDDHSKELVGLLESLRTSAGDNAPWLWVDIPWPNKKRHPWIPNTGIFSSC